MSKHGTALLVAFGISLIVGLAMFVIGGNAALNPNGVPVSNSPASGGALAAGSTSQGQASQAQIDQLQSLVAQYQQREQQYQQREQQYQQVLVYLQQMGIIQIDRSGRILVPGGEN